LRWACTYNSISVQILFENGFKRFQHGTRTRDDNSSGSVGDNIARTIGIPNYILIRTIYTKCDLVTASHFLHPEKRHRIRPEFNRNASVFEQLTAGAADGVEIEITSNLHQAS
jgi:hypothetical protein